MSHLVKPYETHWDLWIWAIQIKCDWSSGIVSAPWFLTPNSLSFTSIEVRKGDYLDFANAPCVFMCVVSPLQLYSPSPVGHWLHTYLPLLINSSVKPWLYQLLVISFLLVFNHSLCLSCSLTYHCFFLMPLDCYPPADPICSLHRSSTCPRHDSLPSTSLYRFTQSAPGPSVRFSIILLINPSKPSTSNSVSSFGLHSSVRNSLAHTVD